MSLRGAPAWRKAMVVRKTLPPIEVQNQKPGDCSYDTPCTNGFCLSCSSCGVQKPVSQRTLHAHGGWIRLKCAACYATCTARNWRCVCDAAWFSCPVHAHVGCACRARVQKLVLKQNCQTGSTFNTNQIPPPSVDDGATLSAAAKRPNVAVRRHTALAGHSGSNSSSEGAQTTPTSVASEPSRKRCSNAQAPKKRVKAKADPSGTSSDSRAAIDRMREARGNPI